MNESKLNILDSITSAYMKVIYDRTSRIEKNINNLRSLILHSRCELKTAELILLGIDRHVNIFTVAFYYDPYFQILKKKPEFEMEGEESKGKNKKGLDNN